MSWFSISFPFWVPFLWVKTQAWMLQKQHELFFIDSLLIEMFSVWMHRQLVLKAEHHHALGKNQALDRHTLAMCHSTNSPNLESMRVGKSHPSRNHRWVGHLNLNQGFLLSVQLCVAVCICDAVIHQLCATMFSCVQLCTVVYSHVQLWCIHSADMHV